MRSKKKLAIISRPTVPVADPGFGERGVCHLYIIQVLLFIYDTRTVINIDTSTVEKNVHIRNNIKVTRQFCHIVLTKSALMKKGRYVLVAPPGSTTVYCSIDSCHYRPSEPHAIVYLCRIWSTCISVTVPMDGLVSAVKVMLMSVRANLV